MSGDSGEPTREQRDALLAELATFHQEILRAADGEDVEVILGLIQERGPLVERLSEVLVAFPLEGDASQALALQERELQSLMTSKLDGIKAEMRDNRARSKAARGYDKNR